ncbi:hypothetical protein E5288_WYG020584 [Bos mutus]|uniref:Uncharacterized protein n=1 Tax=Bos mutus TaxID=72004 RepID=A0A6B0S4I8_9CETA|nr:hypothetical protein [Bos mutus]
MATYPPRRLLGARPLPSDPRRDPRRSDFPPGGGGGRGERRLRTGQSWRVGSLLLTRWRGDSEGPFTPSLSSSRPPPSLSPTHREARSYSAAVTASRSSAATGSPGLLRAGHGP